jgi:hypothetical protein
VSAHLCRARKGVPVRRGIKANVLKRIAANQRRFEEARLRDEREREAIRALAAPIPARISDKVHRLDVSDSAHWSSGKEEQKE